MLEHKSRREVLEAAAAQGGGRIAARLVDVHRLPELLDVARARDEQRGSPELRDLSAVALLLEAIETVPRRQAPQCFICNEAFTGGRSVLLVRPVCDDPNRVIFAFGICAECVLTVGGHDHLLSNILPILREILPGLRDIHVIDAVGHA